MEGGLAEPLGRQSSQGPAGGPKCPLNMSSVSQLSSDSAVRTGPMVPSTMHGGSRRQDICSGPLGPLPRPPCEILPHTTDAMLSSGLNSELFLTSSPSCSFCNHFWPNHPGAGWRAEVGVTRTTLYDIIYGAMIPVCSEEACLSPVKGNQSSLLD